MKKNQETSLISLKFKLHELLNEISNTEDLSDTDSEILFQLSSDPELENLITDKEL
jgi:hypothetical protein